jgi:hypothetical protein
MATITTIQSTDLIANSRADINTNFSNLNTDKAELVSPAFTTPNLGVATVTSINGIATSALVQTSRTVNGKALSANITLGLASADFANQGTTTTVLHGNASGNPAFGAIVAADITDATITYAKIQNVTTARLLGRSTAGSGVMEELTVGTGISLSAGVLSISYGNLYAVANTGTIASSADTTRTVSAGSYTKSKEFAILAAGSYDVYFQLRNTTGSGTTFGRIYKNGVAAGTERSNATSSFVAYNETISGLVAGDLIQLYAYKTIDNGEVTTFRLRAVLVPDATVNTD